MIFLSLKLHSLHFATKTTSGSAGVGHFEAVMQCNEISLLHIVEMEK